MSVEFFDSNARIGTVPNTNSYHFYTAEGLLREMDLFGVAEAFVWHAWTVRWDLASGNEALMRELAAHRDRLHPAWTVGHHHLGQQPPGPELVARMLEQGVRMARLFFSIWGAAQSYVPATFAGLLSALAEARVPLMVEWEQTVPDWAGLSNICGTYPELPVILTNAKLTQWERDWYPLLGVHRNLHIEAAGYQGWRGVEHICHRFGPQRIIFGSRCPVYQIGQTTSMITRALVSSEDAALIAGGNLRRLLAGING